MNSRRLKEFQILPFFRKKHYTNKLISQLNFDGKIIKDKINIANAQKNFLQSLKDLNNEKTPGTDCLQADFY